VTYRHVGHPVLPRWLPFRVRFVVGLFFAIPIASEGAESLDHVQGVRNLKESDDRVSNHSLYPGTFRAPWSALAARVESEEGFDGAVLWLFGW
jgi:hypothetical protein